MKKIAIPIVAAGLLIAACGGATEDGTTDAQPTAVATATELADTSDVSEDTASDMTNETTPEPIGDESLPVDETLVEDDPIVNDLGETAEQEQARIDKWTVTDEGDDESEPQLTDAQDLSLRIIEQAQEKVADGYTGYALDTPCATLRMYHTRTSISRAIAGSDGKGPRDDTYVEIIFADGDTGKTTQKEYASLPYEDKVWVAGEYIDWLCGI